MKSDDRKRKWRACLCCLMDHCSINKRESKPGASHKSWKRRIAFLGVLVAFCTAYMMIAPARTLENTICEQEEHIHSDQCYETKSEAEPKGNLICSRQTLEIHVHDENCQDENGNLICQKSDEVLHVHDENCYDEDHELICTLNEKEKHIHDESCYEADMLVCPESELDVHEHHEDCLDENGQISCGKTEITEHQHTLDCFERVDATPRLICGKNEHTHNSNCYLKPQREPAAPKGLKDYITGAEYKFSEDDGKTWNPPNAQNQIKEGDLVMFSFQYTLPSGVLKQQNPMTYQVPSEIHPVRPESGTFRNQAGQELGTYKITEDGQIELQFNDNTVKKNENSSIDGFFSFTASTDSIQKDENGHVSIPVKDDLPIEFKVRPLTEEEKYDLHVHKSASVLDPVQGIVKYVIEIESAKGTPGPVQLEDLIENAGMLWDNEHPVSVKNQNQNNVEINFTEQSAGKFTASLPKMNGGDKYFIEYYAKANVQSENSIVHNEATVHSNTLHDDVEINTPITQQKIFKTGEILGNGNIRWTIVINPAGNDIGGWVLDDPLDSSVVLPESTVQISPAVNGQNTISFPFTFPPDSKEMYTVTFETEANLVPGQSSLSNTANLTPPEGQGQPVTSTGTVDLGNYNPLDKQEMGYEFGTKENQVIANWQISIHADKGDIAAGWTITENIPTETDHIGYFTESQVNDFVTSLKSQLLELEIDNPSILYEIKQNSAVRSETGNILGWKSFVVTVNHAIPKGTQFSFNFQSTADIVAVNGNPWIKNNARLNNCSEVAAHSVYKPILKKTDRKGGGGATTHEYKDLGSNHELEWLITVQKPPGFSGGSLTLQEYLPEGFTLTYLEALAEGVHGARTISLEHGVWTYTAQENGKSFIYTVKMNPSDSGHSGVSDDSGNLLEIEIPENLMKEETLREIRFVIRGTIDDPQAVEENPNSSVWKVDSEHKFQTGVFANTATLLYNGNSVDSKTQTQTITRKLGEYVDKKAGELKDNVIKFSVVINENGKDILPGAEQIDLTDELITTSGNDQNADMVLVPGSVKLYEYADHVKGDVLNADQYSYQYEQTKTGNAANQIEIQHVLRMKIPDNRPLLLEYEYIAVGTIGNGGTLSNSAWVSGENFEDHKSQMSQRFSVQRVSAGAELKGIQVCKVDSENNLITLRDAVFQLEKWDEIQQRYVIYQDSTDTDYAQLHSNESGMISLPIEPGVVFRLTEKQAPDGYQLDSTSYTFCIDNKPEKVPDDFSGVVLPSGSVLYRGNLPSPDRYEFPETGGVGTAEMQCFGGILCWAAAAAFLQLRKSQK